MFFRYFLILSVIALLSVAIPASADVEPEQDVLVYPRANPAVKIVAKLIGSLFTGAAVSCLGEAAEKCKDHWKHPSQAISCAKNFLRVNKGRCAVGK